MIDRPFIIGLTGGIGSGKSAAAACFAALGAAVIDTDAIAHALTAPGGAAIDQLRATFGAATVTPDGALDRAAMRRRAFADATVRARLEAILHPLIHTDVAAQIHRSADFPYVVLVVPLLAETGFFRESIDRILVIDCPQALQLARAMARSGLSRNEAAAVMAAQAARQTRLAIADDVIVNDASQDALQTQVATLHERYLTLAHRHDRRNASE